MNKRIINLIIAVLFSTATVFASNIISISKDGAKTFVVDPKTWNSEYLSVEIRDNEGIIIFTDEYSTKTGKRFNLENLPNGTYSIILSNNLKSVTQNITVNSNDIIIQQDVETIYKPVVKVQKNFIDLNYFTNSKKTSILIYDSIELIYSIDYNNHITVNKRFDISNLPKGNYSFNVSSGNTSYSESFHK